MKHSKAAQRALDALTEGMVINTLSKFSDSGDWHASVGPRDKPALFTVPIQTFRKLRRDGLVVCDRQWEVSRDLIHSEYVLKEPTP